jgi:hypothetical protein
MHAKSRSTLQESRIQKWIDTIELNNSMHFILVVSVTVILCNDIPNVRQTS